MSGQGFARHVGTTSDVAAYAKGGKQLPQGQLGCFNQLSYLQNNFNRLKLTYWAAPPFSTGNRWIVLTTQYSTRYVVTRAVPDETATEVKFFTESIVLRHGAPEMVITNSRTAFTSRLMQGVMCLNHTSHRKPSVYTPRTNRETKHLNKTIADMLPVYADVDHKA